MGKKLTTDQYINYCKKIHNDFYDYTQTIYGGSNNKIKIVCPNHGLFEQIAQDHKNGSGCYHCGLNKIRKLKYKTTLDFINKSKIIHNDKYDYSNVHYVDATTKVKILCKKHGHFEQTPESHYRGCGCLKCGHERCNTTRINNGNVSTKCWSHTDWEIKSKKSKKFDSYKCYIIKCYDENECFYKIGKTFRKMIERFSNKKEMPYSIEIIKTWIGDVEYISKLEKELQNYNKSSKYMPLKKFGGSYECFSKIDYPNDYYTG